MTSKEKLLGNGNGQSFIRMQKPAIMQTIYDEGTGIYKYYYASNANMT